MTRPSFSTTIPGTYVYRNTSNVTTQGSLANARVGAETVTGTSRRKPTGFIPPTGYNLVRREMHRAWGTSEVKHQTGTWYVWGYIDGQYGIAEWWNLACSEATALTKLDTNAALVAARNKLKNKKVDLGVAFAERKATARMLGDTANRMVKSVRALKDGRFRSAARALGIIGDPGRPRGSNWTNHWLQLQYGWKPLLSDVYGSAYALSRRELSDWRVTAKASRKDTATYKGSLVATSSLGWPSGNYGSRDVVATRERGVFVRLDAVPSNDLTMSLASLGVTNPLLVAWELVPYSFVVDWCLPIGNWLDSLDALLGYGQAWTSITTRNNTEWQETGTSKSFTKGYVRNSFTGTKRLMEINRVGYSHVPLPAFPRFKDPRSLGHMANGLSLLAQVFGR